MIDYGPSKKYADSPATGKQRHGITNNLSILLNYKTFVAMRPTGSMGKKGAKSTFFKKMAMGLAKKFFFRQQFDTLPSRLNIR
jgi:hypothetical protein